MRLVSGGDCGGIGGGEGGGKSCAGDSDDFGGSVLSGLLEHRQALVEVDGAVVESPKDVEADIDSRLRGRICFINWRAS